ncbi:hypothetical protein Pcac1_g2081 [Phytophthora cactorum]|nr:hypothetical protein Pcac1_g2081 [Phytophthora cactorum]KAG3061157.1 hypothetical protein PC122_g19750 [Phytophthora cactorum]
MVNLGGESKQELFDGGLVWCDERAMWARKTRTARLRRLHTCEVTNNGRDDGTNLAVRETVRDGCMRWKGKPVDVWKLAASAKQTDAKDKYVIQVEVRKDGEPKFEGHHAAGSQATGNKNQTSHNVNPSSPHMRPMFEHFPEVLVADDTHDTNSSDYKLFSFMVHDAMGKGQHVQVSCASNPR